MDFKNTVIIMTSNVGARLITDNKPASLGFGSEDGNEEERDFEKTKELVMGEMKNLFRPEFLNRVDDIIVFHKLTSADIREIAVRLLNSLKKRLADLSITVTFTDAAIDAVAEAGFDPVYGARPLKRAIQSKIEDALSECMLDGTVKAGKTVVLRLPR